MREIKFRGKRKDNGEWVYGNVFIPNKMLSGIYICPETNYIDFAPGYEGSGMDIEEIKKQGCILGYFIEVDSVTIGQFTGITDANGREVYEGDIVEYATIKTKFIAKVEWERKASAFWMKWMDGKMSRYHEIHCTYGDGKVYVMDQIQVRGNIHQNPDLLTPSQSKEETE